MAKAYLTLVMKCKTKAITGAFVEARHKGKGGGDGATMQEHGKGQF